MMAEIIPFNTNKTYRKLIWHTSTLLEQMEEDVRVQIINLATEGKWKQWSEEQPIGTEFTFTDEALRDTSDENVDLLWKLIDNIVEIRENFEEQMNVRRKQFLKESKERLDMYNKEWLESLSPEARKHHIEFLERLSPEKREMLENGLYEEGDSDIDD